MTADHQKLTDAQKAAQFFYEIGQLKRVRRSGWWLIGVDDPESVAEHAHRTAVIGTLLAVMEGADPARTALLCVMHDNHETRITDLHRVAKRYLVHRTEFDAARHQATSLPARLSNVVSKAIVELEASATKEAIVAQDADKLECLIQAREYQNQGYRDADDWIANCRSALQTPSAVLIADASIELDPHLWWRPLKVQPMTAKGRQRA